MHRVLAIAVTVGLSLAFASAAGAQGGSVGGTIGKKGKSISGDESSSAPSHSTARRLPAQHGPGLIKVTSATLGENCGTPRGNVTDRVAAICDGKETCSLPGSQVRDPDPAFGCVKSFAAEWRCGSGKTRSNSVPPVWWETNVLTLSCR